MGLAQLAKEHGNQLILTGKRYRYFLFNINHYRLVRGIQKQAHDIYYFLNELWIIACYERLD